MTATTPDRAFIGHRAGFEEGNGANGMTSDLDGRAVNFCFGGPERDLLLITTDTAVWAGALAAKGARRCPLNTPTGSSTNQA